MKQYVCLASAPWQGIPTRTQQLMARLKDAQVLYFEPPANFGSRRRPKNGWRVRPGLTVYTLPSILEFEERHTYLFRHTQSKLARFIEYTIHRHRFRDPVLWCTCPSQVHLLDFLSYRGLIYDCDQEWNRFPLRWESDLALASDVIFAASPNLIDRLSPCNDNIALLPNGANYSMFCREALPIPPELQSLNRPVLGYSGTVWPDLDLSPIRRAAVNRPDCIFLFVGRVEKNPLLHALQVLTNVAFLGEKPPADLPSYLNRFDVCLNLLRSRQLGNDILSPRIYEYLCTGKPIVSMLYEDQVEFFPDVIYNAHSIHEFTQLCNRALEEGWDWICQRRRAYGAANAWSSRASEVSRILETIGLS